MSKQVLSCLAGFCLILFVACSGGDAHDAAHAESHGDDDAAHGHDGDADHGHDTDVVAEAIATIEPKSDSGVEGTATFAVAGEQVMMTLSITNATPGEHAFHLHEVGDCSSPDGKSAGGHWNPTGHDHGRWGQGAFHLGDVGNLDVGEDGSASLTVATNLWSVGTGDDNDVVGRAVIVHAGVDDFTTQPTGAAGGRIGCGVIQLTE